MSTAEPAAQPESEPGSEPGAGAPLRCYAARIVSGSIASGSRLDQRVRMFRTLLTLPPQMSRDAGRAPKQAPLRTHSGKDKVAALRPVCAELSMPADAAKSTGPMLDCGTNDCPAGWRLSAASSYPLGEPGIATRYTGPQRASRAGSPSLLVECDPRPPVHALAKRLPQVANRNLFREKGGDD